MENKLITFLKKCPLFLCLLPIFFVLHGCVENYDFVPAKDAIMLTGLYLLATIVLLLLSWLLYRNWMKAALLTGLIMAFHFFFGSLQDFLRGTFPGSLLSKYVFILPFCFCVLLFTAIVLKKRKKALLQVALYLNVLFVLLIAIDLTMLGTKIANAGSKKNELGKEFEKCIGCPKPDVYLVIADEYPGNKELKDLFNFDNTAFVDQLSQRGFHVVPNSSSNYNYTPYSIASILNMDYLDLDRSGKQPLLAYTYETISNNRFLRFLQQDDYKFYNYSLSDFKGYPSHAQQTFLPVKTKLITGQTFLSRIDKELRYHLVTNLKSKKAIRDNVYANRDNNRKILELLKETAVERSTQPKFVLVHLMMPHYPYYYDKNGKEFPFETLFEGNQVNQHNFIEYLQYSNKKFLEMIDGILQNSSSPPIIILIGDHGFRHFNNPIDTRYYFNNLLSVLLPNKNYAAFPDSLANVNVLRTVLNTSFGQRLPYLEDTTFVMDNP